jgi:hypothetical protein
MEHVKLIIQQSPVDIKMPSDFTPKLNEPPEQYNLAGHFVHSHVPEARNKKFAVICLSD